MGCSDGISFEIIKWFGRRMDDRFFALVFASITINAVSSRVKETKI